MMGVFTEWQGKYAAVGIPTFPIKIEGRDKKPLTKGYQRSPKTRGATGPNRSISGWQQSMTSRPISPSELRSASAIERALHNVH